MIAHEKRFIHGHDPAEPTDTTATTSTKNCPPTVTTFQPWPTHGSITTTTTTHWMFQPATSFSIRDDSMGILTTTTTIRLVEQFQISYNRPHDSDHSVRRIIIIIIIIIRIVCDSHRTTRASSSYNNNNHESSCTDSIIIIIIIYLTHGDHERSLWHIYHGITSTIVVDHSHFSLTENCETTRW